MLNANMFVNHKYWKSEIKNKTMRISKYVRQKLFIQNDNDKVPSLMNVLFSLFVLF